MTAKRSFLLITLSLYASAAIFMLSGCQPLTEGAKHAADSSKKAVYDTKAEWTNLFTYHPKNAPQLPQTRYCYQTQSDIVCYDSPQSGQTAKLYGYQDGRNRSWFQPGGGALGVSGGEPLAGYDSAPIGIAVPITRLEASAASSQPQATACMPGGPFACGESSYVKGVIDTAPVAMPTVLPPAEPVPAPKAEIVPVPMPMPEASATPTPATKAVN